MFDRLGSSFVRIPSPTSPWRAMKMSTVYYAMNESKISRSSLYITFHDDDQTSEDFAAPK